MASQEGLCTMELDRYHYRIQNISRCCYVTDHNIIKYLEQISRFHCNNGIKSFAFCRRATLPIRISLSLLQYCTYSVRHMPQNILPRYVTIATVDNKPTRPDKASRLLIAAAAHLTGESSSLNFPLFYRYNQLI